MTVESLIYYSMLPLCKIKTSLNTLIFTWKVKSTPLTSLWLLHMKIYEVPKIRFIQKINGSQTLIFLMAIKRPFLSLPLPCTILNVWFFIIMSYLIFFIAVSTTWSFCPYLFTCFLSVSSTELQGLKELHASLSHSSLIPSIWNTAWYISK